MGTLLLGALYFLVVTPVGLVARLVRDPMARRWDENAESYRIPSKGRKD